MHKFYFLCFKNSSYLIKKPLQNTELQLKQNHSLLGACDAKIDVVWLKFGYFKEKN